MLSNLFANDSKEKIPREGDICKRLTVFGKTFEIRYGYYEDFEREHHDPMAIYPDFRKEPVYSADGYPFVTAMQDICPHYSGAREFDGCSECIHFRKGEDLIGICLHGENRKEA